MEPPRVGYLVPEFPGQTHVWIWREIDQLRRWGMSLRIFATRRPPVRDRARHEFVAEAEQETTYLWPLGAWNGAVAVLSALVAHPGGVARCLALSLTLPTDGRFRRLRLLALIPLACELARRCRQQHIDHLHSHSCGSSAVLCMMARRLTRLPYSLTLNAKIEWWGGAMAQKLSEAQFTNTHAEWLLDEVRRAFPTLHPRQTVLARTGVNTEMWSPRARTHVSDGAIRIITVARLERLKAHDVTLEAVRILGDGGLPLSVRFVGDGPQRAEIEAQVRRLGLEGAVTFTGSLGQEQIIELMAESDIFVLVGRFEALGVAYMEAMAMELATIGTTAGGVREIIDDGVDGVLVPPDEPVMLAEAIRKLARDSELRRRMGQAGRRKIVTRFDSRLGAAILYEQFMGAPPPSAPVVHGQVPAASTSAHPASRSMEPSP
jgi:colanic acid/amylovoran biosynthesis glycosyltransferase